MVIEELLKSNRLVHLRKFSYMDGLFLYIGDSNRVKTIQQLQIKHASKTDPRFLIPFSQSKSYRESRNFSFFELNFSFRLQLKNLAYHSTKLINCHGLPTLNLLNLTVNLLHNTNSS